MAPKIYTDLSAHGNVRQFRQGFRTFEQDIPASIFNLEYVCVCGFSCIHTVFWVMMGEVSLETSPKKTSKTGTVRIFKFFSRWSCNPPHQKKLQAISESQESLVKLRSDLQPKGHLEGCQLPLSQSQEKELENLSSNYIAPLRDDIVARFEEALLVLSCISVFNPLSFLSEKKITAYSYEGETSSMEHSENEVGAEWQKFRNDVLSWKPNIPKNVVVTYDQEEKKTQ